MHEVAGMHDFVYPINCTNVPKEGPAINVIVVCFFLLDEESLYQIAQPSGYASKCCVTGDINEQSNLHIQRAIHTRHSPVHPYMYPYTSASWTREQHLSLYESIKSYHHHTLVSGCSRLFVVYTHVHACRLIDKRRTHTCSCFTSSSRHH